jgi:hypothetical protein
MGEPFRGAGLEAVAPFEFSAACLPTRLKAAAGIGVLHELDVIAASSSSSRVLAASILLSTVFSPRPSPFGVTSVGAPFSMTSFFIELTTAFCCSESSYSGRRNAIASKMSFGVLPLFIAFCQAALSASNSACG